MLIYFIFSWNKALEFLIEVEDPKKKATKKDGAKLTKKEKKKIKACFTVSDRLTIVHFDVANAYPPL